MRSLVAATDRDAVAAAGQCKGLRLGQLCDWLQAKYGKTGSNSTEGLPASGMRIYATTEAILNASYEKAVQGRR